MASLDCWVKAQEDMERQYMIFKKNRGTQSKTESRLREIRSISTGYARLDKPLGGGWIKGSTNLIIDNSQGCGYVFLTSLLEQRIRKYGDVGVVDCFSITPEQLKRLCKFCGMDLGNWHGKLYMLDFTAKSKIKSALGTNRLDDFAVRYVKMISQLIPVGNIFSVVLSLSGFVIQYGEEQIYKHLMDTINGYSSYSRTAVYLVEKNFHTEDFVSKLKGLFDSVIQLNGSNRAGNISGSLYVEKSPLPKHDRLTTLPYHIISNNGEIVFGKIIE